MARRNSTKIRKAQENDAEKAERLEREATARISALAANIGVPQVQIDRGHIAEATIVDLSGDLGGKRMSIVKVLINRGATVIDRWIANDEKDQFGEPQRRAIAWVSTLWAKADGSIGRSGTGVASAQADEGASQTFAISELALLKGRFPPGYWLVFENVCRWDVDAAGATRDPGQIDSDNRARTIVAFVASKIAEWRGF